MMTNTFKLALAAVALSATPALAAAETQNSVKVSYADLDLSSDAGVKELDARIDRAAKAVCGTDRAMTGTRIKSNSARECYKEARNKLDRHFAQVKRKANLGG